MSDQRPRVLVTLADVAWPVDAGKRLRSASMVRALAERCDLQVLVLFADADPVARPLPPEVAGDFTIIGPQLRPAYRTGPDVIRHLLPWQIAVQDWTRVRQHLAAKSPAPYDLVWFGALDHFAQLRSSVLARRMIVDCDDVETEKLRRFLSLPRSAALPLLDRVQRRVELPMWGRIQRQAVRRADAVLVCSDLDRTRLIAQAAGADPAAAARIISVANTYPEPVDQIARAPVGECTFVMIANYGTDQNLDAVAFTAREVLPELRKAVPGARIRLVGRRSDRLAEFEGIEGLDIVGAVDSVALELAQAHAVLVPIRFGGGTRLKVVEAFAYGVPVIATHAGAEGIDARDGTDLLLADNPREIALAAKALLDDPELAARLAASGRAIYQRSYRPEAAAATVGALLTTLFSNGISSTPG